MLWTEMKRRGGSQWQIEDQYVHATWTRQATYVQRNGESRSRYHYCNGKAINVTYYESVCGLSYPAYNGHAPYCHLWSVRLRNIFPHYLTNGTIFGKNKSLNIKCVFICYTKHQPTPYSRVLPDKLKGPQLVKKFPSFHGTRKFITAFTSTGHLSLSSARAIQSMPTHPTS